jgi:eukaryotic-like serine/threonine-protein kinase
MAISTIESFLQSLQQSNLLDADQLLVAREMARQTDDPRGLARLLLQKGLLTRWQAGQLLIGRTSFFLGRYRLMDLLGRGGMGSVFLAQHMMMNRTVAVKVISRELSQDPASRERFIEEARAVAALDHPNIVHAYTVDSEGDRYYMVLEYIEGQDLQRTVESRGPLDYPRAADFIRQTADGLAHAHSKGLVHRDIKPSNLLVNPQGVVKILDLGMARLMVARDGGRGTEGSGVRKESVLGSVDYMAPEQGVQGPDLDHRADIYSLGCTLYYLLTGVPPFSEGTLPERILKHQFADPPGILLKRPGAPRDLVKICEKMMAKDPADRFQSAAEVSKLLAAWRPPQRILKAVPLDE